MAKGEILHNAGALTVTVPMIKALARAHSWKRILESGEFATVQYLAKAERINPSYVARILRLTLLAPDIVVAILDGRQPAALQLGGLLAPFPVEWDLCGLGDHPSGAPRFLGRHRIAKTYESSNRSSGRGRKPTARTGPRPTFMKEQSNSEATLAARP